MIVEYLGWLATAVFVSSYFFSRATMLRRAQIAGASLWMIYGFALRAWPVVVANALVFAAASFTGIASSRRDTESPAG
jgi:hypothetical protein